MFTGWWEGSSGEGSTGDEEREDFQSYILDKVRRGRTEAQVVGLAVDRSRDSWVCGEEQEADVGEDTTGGWLMWSSLRRFPSDCFHFTRKMGTLGIESAPTTDALQALAVGT